VNIPVTDVGALLEGTVLVFQDVMDTVIIGLMSTTRAHMMSVVTHETVI